MPTIKQKLYVIATTLVVLSITTFSFAVFHNEDGSDAVAFLLTDQNGRKVTHEDFSGKPLLVFFGFTSCDDVCPIGLSTLAGVMKKLKQTSQDDDIALAMITVDPERDTPERMKSYMASFNDSFIGLTGSRVALENVAAEFNTFLDKPPKNATVSHTSGLHDGAHHSLSLKSSSATTAQGHALSELDKNAMHLVGEHGGAEFIDNYQLTHSSVVYVVDRYSRVIDYISLDDDVEKITEVVREHLIMAIQG